MSAPITAPAAGPSLQCHCCACVRPVLQTPASRSVRGPQFSTTQPPGPMH